MSDLAKLEAALDRMTTAAVESLPDGDGWVRARFESGELKYERIADADFYALPDPRQETERRAFEQGYTELRFNSETMGWAYHKPDQAVAPDGRVYVRAPSVRR